MRFKFACIYFLLTLFTVFYTNGQATDGRDRICGKWESVEKNIIIQVYMAGDDFKADRKSVV